MVAQPVGGIPSVDVGDGADALGGGRHVDPEGVGRGEGEGATDGTGPTRHGDVDAGARPSCSTAHPSPSGTTVQSGVGRSRPQPGQLHDRSVNSWIEPQAGQTRASPRQ